MLRGYTVISMIAFHAVYDIAYLYGFAVPWFTVGPMRELWRISISWVFLALAGWMTIHSRNNARRGCQYAVVAILVWIVTSIVRVDTPISFGIIYCMAACTLGFALLERTVLARPWSARSLGALAGICMILALACYQVPRARYGISGLAWLGFPSPGFASGDYYPLIPFGFIYLAGALLARAWRQQGTGAYPAWFASIHCAPLEVVGRHALLLYMVHQPVVLICLRLCLGT